MFVDPNAEQTPSGRAGGNQSTKTRCDFRPNPRPRAGIPPDNKNVWVGGWVLLEIVSARGIVRALLGALLEIVGARGIVKALLEDC